LANLIYLEVQRESSGDKLNHLVKNLANSFFDNICESEYSISDQPIYKFLAKIV
jgi:hypothetical protein